MSSMLSDHLASGENAADVPDGGLDAIDRDCHGPSHDLLAREESTEIVPVDCCPSCGERFEELQLRISQIERRLEELLADECGVTAGAAELRTTSNAWNDEQAAAIDQAVAIEDGPRDDASEVAGWTETPIDTMPPLSGNEQSASSIIEDRSTGSQELPAWAEAYQSDDVDESVKDYVDRLLQRMGTDEQRPSYQADQSHTGTEGDNELYSPEQQTDSLHASTDPSETDSRSTRDDLPSRESLRMEVVKSGPIAEDRLVPEESIPASFEAVPVAQEVYALQDNSPVEVADYRPSEPYEPRSLPPERQANLDEMRALANISATAAIRTFEKGRAAKHAFDRLPLMMVGLSCGLFLLYFATTCDGRMMKLTLYAGAGLSFLASTVAAGQAMSVLFRWMARAKEDDEAVSG